MAPGGLETQKKKKIFWKMPIFASQKHPAWKNAGFYAPKTVLF
jgi:hypothetical protein